MLKHLKKHFPFALLFLFFITLRVVQLCAHYHIIHPEEAQLGMLIKHLLKGSRSVELFNYFLPYSGGSVIACLLSAPICKIIGVSTVALRGISFFYSAAILVLLYFFARRFWGGTVALLAAFFYVLSPPSYSHYTALFLSGEYFVVFLDILILYLFARLCFADCPEEGRERALLTVGLGFFSGLALYFLFSSFLFTALTAGSLLIIRGRFLKSRELFWYGLAFLVGVFPFIYSFWAYPPQNNLLAYCRLENIGLLTHKITWLLPFLFSEFVRSFHFEFFNSYPERFYWNYIYALIMFSSWLYLFWMNRRSFRGMFYNLRCLRPGQLFSAPAGMTLEAILLLIPVLFILFCLFSAYCRPGSFHYRYFFPLYPIFYLLFAISAHKLFSQPLKSVKAGVLAVLFILTIISWRGVAGITGKQNFWERVALPEAISFLKSQGIKHIYSDYFLKWQVLFESSEEILVSNADMPFFFFSDLDSASDCRIYGSHYSGYEVAVEKALKDKPSFAYLFVINPRLPYYAFLESYLCSNNIVYKRKLIGRDLIALYGSSRYLPPEEISLGVKMKKYLFERRGYEQ